MISRALAIFALACLAGSVHLLVRGKPIHLSRAPRVVEDAPGANPPDSNPPADPGSGRVSDPGTTPADANSGQTPVADPYAAFATNPLFDQPVGEGHLTMREAYALFEAGSVFLDARHDYEYEAGHIAGAIFMPSTRLSSGEGLEEAYALDPSTPIVIYCTGGECDASENTAVLLSSLNPDFDLRILGLGYDDWAAVGLPVEGTP